MLRKMTAEEAWILGLEDCIDFYKFSNNAVYSLRKKCFIGNDTGTIYLSGKIHSYSVDLNEITKLMFNSANIKENAIARRKYADYLEECKKHNLDNMEGVGRMMTDNETVILGLQGFGKMYRFTRNGNCISTVTGEFSRIGNTGIIMLNDGRSLPKRVKLAHIIAVMYMGVTDILNNTILNIDGNVRNNAVDNICVGEKTKRSSRHACEQSVAQKLVDKYAKNRRRSKYLSTH